MNVTFGNSCPTLRSIRSAAHLRLTVAIFCAGLLCPALAAEDYNGLILRAQAGDTAPALDYLRREIPAKPDDKKFIADWIEVAGWAGLDAEVTQIYRDYGTRVDLAPRTIAAIARAYRNQRAWDDSAALYLRALAKEPHNTDLRIGQINLLADAGRDADALRSANALVADAPLDARRRLALAYVHTAALRPYAALAEVTRARSLARDDLNVERAYIDALQTAGLPTVAERLSNTKKGLLPDVQHRRLKGDVGAELVRLAFAPERSEFERYQIADRALALYDKLLTEWSLSPAPDVVRDIQRLRIDRLGALTARSRMAEAVAEYDALRGSNVVLPDYAARWIAGAYLYLAKPELARDLYREVLSHDAAIGMQSPADASGLFYALVEVESMDQALELAEANARRRKPVRYVNGLNEPLPNDEWADAQAQAALAHSFADNLPEAQLRLERMLGLAPGNMGLRTAIAGVYRARAWPRRAEEELKLGESMDARNLALELQQGFTALELQEWNQADLLASDVMARFPENRQSQRLSRLRDVHNMAELKISGYRASSSNNPAIGNRDYGIDAVAYSAPIGVDWRIFGGAGFGSGDFREGPGTHRTVRAGADWRVRDNTVEAEVSSHSFGFGRRAGWRLEARHDFNDQWQAGAAVEQLSRNTPLRALTSNLTADGATAFLRWRANERREWTVSLAPLRYSDGNNNMAVSLLGRERLYTRPYLSADLVLALASSRNSQQAGPYFSPVADFSMLPTLEVAHVIYRRYQTEWRQQFVVGAGTYAQRDFATGSTATIGYSQRVRMNDVLEAALGFTVMRRPYDGRQENISRGTFDFLYRF